MNLLMKKKRKNKDLKNKLKKKLKRKNKNNKNKTKKTELYRSKIPWTLNLVYAANYSNTGLEPGKIGVHTVGFSGNLELTPKWSIGYSSGYDVKNGAFSFSRFNLSRDLDVDVDSTLSIRSAIRSVFGFGN